MQGQTGSYVLTTLLIPPNSSTLTTLADVKTELGIPTVDTSKDASLTQMISQASTAIAGYCRRIFGFASWQDQFRPQRGVRGEGVRGANNPLQLKHWPLSVAPVAFIGNTHSSNTVDGIASTFGLVQGMLALGAGIPPATTIASVSANSITLSQAATATTSAVSLMAGLQVLETVAGTTTQLIPGTDFEIELSSGQPGDDSGGRLYRLNDLGNPKTWPAALIVVAYQAGYLLPNDTSTLGPTMPQDLEAACLRLITMRFKAQGRDPTLVERMQTSGVGTERFWVGAQPNQTGSLPPEIAHMLEPYRTPVVAVA